MRRLLSGLLAMGLVGAAPAFAETSVPQEDDLHLHLRTEREFVSIYGMARHRWGRYRPYVVHEVTRHAVITQGDLPLSSERFVDLVEESGAAPAFTARVNGLRQARTTWGLATLGSLAATVAGSGLASAGRSNPSGAAVSSVGLTLAAVGLASTLVTGVVWSDLTSRPLFTLDQAGDAIRAYNRKLDQRTAPGTI